MNAFLTQQEILLSVALSRNFPCKPNEARQPQSDLDRLEEACWNGLLAEMVPEIVKPTSGAEKLFLWHTRQGPSLVQIKLGEFPLHIEKPFSIDPHLSLSSGLNN